MMPAAVETDETCGNKGSSSLQSTQFLKSQNLEDKL